MKCRGLTDGRREEVAKKSGLASRPASKEAVGSRERSRGDQLMLNRSMMVIALSLFFRTNAPGCDKQKTVHPGHDTGG